MYTIGSSGKRLQRRARWRIGFIVLAIILIGFGTWGLWRRHATTPSAQLALPTEVITHSTDEPDESSPDEACHSLKVAADIPLYVEIPSLDISGCISRVGIDQYNRIAVPTNIHVAGWYVHSALPGQSGVGIIDGHVTGRRQPGIFKRLGELQSGQRVRIQFGDQSWREFEVFTTAQFNIETTTTEQYKQEAGVDKQLTLITCGGAYDQTTRTYDQRVVVRAKLVEAL